MVLWTEEKRAWAVSHLNIYRDTVMVELSLSDGDFIQIQPLTTVTSDKILALIAEYHSLVDITIVSIVLAQRDGSQWNYRVDSDGYFWSLDCTDLWTEVI